MRRREIMLDDAILTNSLKKKKKTYTGTVLDKRAEVDFSLLQRQKRMLDNRTA